ncbi:MAG: dihydroorotase [Candidatus Cloacimonetes bacterium]|nr:dihydroorotase [Candidatus Cloacimonadota bacterium]
MRTLIKNGLVYRDGAFVQADVLLDNDRIAEVGQKLTAKADSVFDAIGKHVMPGFIDLHVHLRDPGQMHKEDIVSGTRAAAKGGFTTVQAMANTDPVVDNLATVEYINRKAKELGSCKVLVVGALTRNSEGKEIASIANMLKGGITAVSDDGSCVQEGRLKFNALKYAAGFNIPVIVHAEDYSLAGSGQVNGGKISTQLGLSGIPALAEEVMIARDIMFAEKIRCRLHIAHISTARSIEMVQWARQAGLDVTAEVTPHHLLLTEEACVGFDTNTKVKPPLRTEKDRRACFDALREGVIDFIATDHAPHADYEKDREFTLAPYGINGFETAFCSLYEGLVLAGELPLETLVQRMAEAPARFLSLDTGRIEPGLAADVIMVDLDGEVSITPDAMLSKSKNTPFLGRSFKGRVLKTWCDGRITWDADDAE